MPCAPSTPVIIGVGDVVNRSRKPEDALEPLELMLQAINLAIDDACPQSKRAELKASIDSIEAVKSWTWPYRDLPGLISTRLRTNPKRKHLTEHGGNQPGKIFDEAARRIATGHDRVVVLTGGEALASLSACAAAKKMPPPGWTEPDQQVEAVFSPTTRELPNSASPTSPSATATATANSVEVVKPGDWRPTHMEADGPDLGAKHNIGNPIHIYPLYENAFRAHRKQSLRDNQRESAGMYAQFASVAEHNEHAWSYGKPAKTAEEIGSVNERNRMICFPYPLLMNAFNTVNLAAAIILTSVAMASKLGVPEEKWVYALGGAGTQDCTDFWKRPDYYSSPALARSLDAALQVSGLSVDKIDLYDFYSCFPIVPKLACHHLGLSCTSPGKPITLLGGLTFFGGAGNNYSMHAITEMARQLRSGRGKAGLVLANGGVVTYQHVVCLSTCPRADGSAYAEQPGLPELITDVPVPEVFEKAEGTAVVETYTVEFSKDGRPFRGHIVGRLSSGERFLSNHADDQTLQALTSWSVEPIGRTGFVKTDAIGKNLFSFSSMVAKL